MDDRSVGKRDRADLGKTRRESGAYRSRRQRESSYASIEVITTWIVMRVVDIPELLRPRFGPDILNDMSSLHRLLAVQTSHIPASQSDQEIDYAVQCSRM